MKQREHAGVILRSLRIQAGARQLDVADAMERGQPSICSMEHGQRRVSVAQLRDYLLCLSAVGDLDVAAATLAVVWPGGVPGRGEE